MTLDSRNRRRLQAALLVAGILAVVAIIALRGPLAPRVVQVAEAARGDLAPTVFGVGTVEARYRHATGFVRAGRLLEVRVDQGDRVQRGAVMARLDPVDLPARIEAARARVDELRARLALARREAARYAELGKRQQASREQVDAKATEAEATASLLRAARAELAALEAQLADLTLRSPVDGVVVARHFDAGSVVLPGVAVLEVVDPAALWVRVRVDQHRARGLAVGQRAEIFLRRAPETPLPGRVARLERVADSLTEEQWVDVAFERLPVDVPLGSLANVVIHLPVLEDALWVPAAAVHRHAGRDGVWLVEDGRSRFRPLRFGLRTEDGRVQVLDGLQPGERVVVYAARPLVPDARVRVRP